MENMQEITHFESDAKLVIAKLFSNKYNVKSNNFQQIEIESYTINNNENEI